MTEPRFPRLEDGPPKQSWAPAEPAHAGPADKRVLAFKFSVMTEDGVTHRFLMTRDGMAWLAMAMINALSPRLGRLALWWYRYQTRISSQSPRSSGMPSFDGSPQEGRSV